VPAVPLVPAYPGVEPELSLSLLQPVGSETATAMVVTQNTEITALGLMGTTYRLKLIGFRVEPLYNGWFQVR
jgi:hypothetical protein